jgi:glycosyltransferase involved in cell wall biosynthesis
MTDNTFTVAMDVRPLLKEGSGVGYYIKNLVTKLNSYPDIHMKLFSLSYKDRFDKDEHFNLFDFAIYDHKIPIFLIDYLWHTVQYPPLEKLVSYIDIVHTPHCYYIPSKCQNQIITIHDLFHLKEPELFGLIKTRKELNLIKRSAERATNIIAVSEFTKKDIIEILDIPEHKIEVIHNAPSLQYAKDTNKQIQNIPHEIKTILTVGTLEYRKNYINLLDAFKIAKNRLKDIRLVIVGKDGVGAQKIKEKAAELKFHEDELIFTSYIKENELVDLYSKSDLFVFPSLEEGFGFPPLDAMNFGIPVISSKNGALQEILKDGVYYINHLQPESIADAMIKILKDDDVRDNLISKGKIIAKSYTWESAAAKTYRLYRNIMSNIHHES